VIPVDKITMACIVDLINEYSDATRTVAGESDDPYPPLEQFDTFDATLSELVDLANDLHRVFARPDRAVVLLNSRADHLRLSHRLAPDGQLTWTRHATSHRIAAGASATLIDFVGQHGSDRLGTCDAHACVDVYIDASQGKNRSYCSDRCHTRTRVARWRARRRFSAGSSGIA
jgi:predicted RNA-binding Zn ribbon-like protein